MTRKAWWAEMHRSEGSVVRAQMHARNAPAREVQGGGGGDMCPLLPHHGPQLGGQVPGGASWLVESPVDVRRRGLHTHIPNAGMCAPPRGAACAGAAATAGRRIPGRTPAAWAP